LKSEMPSKPSSTPWPSITNEQLRLRSAGSPDQRIAMAPVVTVTREQAHALTLALHDQTVAVVLDFVQPIGSRRNLGSARRDAGFKGNVTHRG